MGRPHEHADPRFLLALWAGKAVAWVIGVFFPRRGTNKSGVVACRIAPGFLRGFTGIDPKKTIFITGTNGKSTSNNLIVHAFRTAGRSVATNLEGANLVTGIATALLKNSTASGRLRTEYLICEVDERSLARVRAAIPAAYLCVTNIQKDQVQRNGDPDYILRKILAAMDDQTTVFVNNEEPRSSSLSSAAGRTVRFSVAPRRPASPADEYAVTMPCPLCHDTLAFSSYNLANIGDFSCPKCGFSSRVHPDYHLDRVDYEAQLLSINGHEFHLEYDAAHFLYNYALCYAVAAEFGLTPGQVGRAFETFRNVGGRLEEFRYRSTSIRYLRIKQENPETLQSAIDDISPRTVGPRHLTEGETVFVLGLQLVHDIVPHYSNTAYFFDCDLTPLVERGVETCICFGSVNCYDAATRLVYAGFPEDKIVVVDSDDPKDVLEAVARCRAPRAYLMTMLGEYEALRAYADAGRARPRPKVVGAETTEGVESRNTDRRTAGGRS